MNDMSIVERLLIGFGTVIVVLAFFAMIAGMIWLAENYNTLFWVVLFILSGLFCTALTYLPPFMGGGYER